MTAPEKDVKEEGTGKRRNEVVRDIATGRQAEVSTRGGLSRFPHGVTTSVDGTHRLEILPDDPTSAVCETSWTTRQEKGRWKVRTETRTRLTSDPAFFHLEAEMTAYSGDRKVSHRRWRKRIRRKCL